MKGILSAFFLFCKLWGKKFKIFLFPFALRLFFLSYGGQFYVLCKMHLKGKSPSKRVNILDHFSSIETAS